MYWATLHFMVLMSTSYAHVPLLQFTGLLRQLDKLDMPDLGLCLPKPLVNINLLTPEVGCFGCFVTVLNLTDTIAICKLSIGRITASVKPSVFSYPNSS